MSAAPAAMINMRDGCTATAPPAPPHPQPSDQLAQCAGSLWDGWKGGWVAVRDGGSGCQKLIFFLPHLPGQPHFCLTCAERCEASGNKSTNCLQSKLI